MRVSTLTLNGLRSNSLVYSYQNSYTGQTAAQFANSLNMWSRHFKIQRRVLDLFPGQLAQTLVVFVLDYLCCYSSLRLARCFEFVWMGYPWTYVVVLCSFLYVLDWCVTNLYELRISFSHVRSCGLTIITLRWVPGSYPSTISGLVPFDSLYNINVISETVTIKIDKSVPTGRKPRRPGHAIRKNW